MSNINDFVIENGILKKYVGKNEKVIIPDGVIQIEDDVFIHSHFSEVEIPDSVKYIGKYAFCNNMYLRKVIFRGVDVAVTVSQWSGYNIKFVLPEGFLATQMHRASMLIPHVNTLSVLENAYIILFHDEKWLAFAQNKNYDVNEIARELINIIPFVKKMTPKMLQRLIDFVFWNTELSSENIQEIYEAISHLDKKAAEKFKKNALAQNAKKNEGVMEEVEPIENYALSLLDKKPLHPLAHVFSKGIAYKGKEKLCTPQLLNILASEYLYVFDEYSSGNSTLIVPDNAFIPEEADKIANELDREALTKELEKLVQSGVKKYCKWMYLYARFATEESIKHLIKNPPEGFGPSMRKYWRENFSQAILFSETKTAIEYVEKNKTFEKYARLRGLSALELRDKYLVPEWNINENGVIVSTSGLFDFAISNNFSVIATERKSEKEMTSIPAKKYPEDARELKEFKKIASDFYKKRLGYLRKIYITAEQINLKHWIETYCNNPILRPITEKLIWSDKNRETFMLINGVFQKADGSEYQPEEWVALAHILDMSPEKVDEWQEYLIKNTKKLLIEQVWEPECKIINGSRYINQILTKSDRDKLKRELGKKQIDVKFESDYNFFDYRNNTYPGTIRLGNHLFMSYTYKINTDETILTGFGKMTEKITREQNAILYELGRVCIKSAIRKDDVALLVDIFTTEYTVAQILEFISIANESNSVNSIAFLLEHKNKYNGEFDPMAEFILD